MLVGCIELNNYIYVVYTIFLPLKPTNNSLLEDFKISESSWFLHKIAILPLGLQESQCASRC